MKRFILAITGASGACYAKRLFDILKDRSELHVVISERGIELLNLELSLKTSYFFGDNVTLYKNSKINTCIASGSFYTDGMIIVPASMNTISSISNGITDNLIKRAADVMIKEKRELVLVPRETPLNALHLKNMTKLAQLGVKIFPPNPPYYLFPKNIEDINDFIVQKLMVAIGVQDKLPDNYIYNEKE